MIILVLALLGVILGSFVNALVWRIHEQGELGKRKSKKSKGRNKEKSTLSLNDLSITKGRSMCPDCHHVLAARDLVPVLSWLSLKGRCRYCGKPVSWQYPVVELLTGLLFAVSYASWPLALHGVGLFQFMLWLAFITAFMALAVYDLRWLILPDRIVLPLNLLAGLQVLVTALWLHSFTALWQPIAAAAIIFGLFWGLFQISKGTWIGGGDVKLAITLGLLVGTPMKAFLVIFFASLIGTLVSIPLLARGKKGLKLHIPFGPYLLAATFIVVLYGAQVIAWYQNLLLG
jgi:leader peptidase (prepilin peptidase) / N-methyltransferase